MDCPYHLLISLWPRGRTPAATVGECLDVLAETVVSPGALLLGVLAQFIPLRLVGRVSVVRQDLLHLTLCAPHTRLRIREPLPVALAKVADRLAFSAVDVWLTKAIRFNGALERSSWVPRAEGGTVLETRRRSSRPCC